jgi:hypothetical protein
MLANDRKVRKGALHILNDKPDARTNKPIAQFTIDPLARITSSRT